MAGLHCQDRARGRQVGCAHDVCGRAQVGADAYTFEDRGCRDEVCHVRDAEVVRAGGYGGCAGFHESGGQEGNVRHFVGGDFFQVGVEGRVEAAGCEVGLGEVFETFLVEGVFEVLEGEGIVEDVGVGYCWGGLTDFLEEGATACGLDRGFFEEDLARSGTHVWATGLAAATAANAAMTNAAFMLLLDYTIESAGGRG